MPSLNLTDDRNAFLGTKEFQNRFVHLLHRKSYEKLRDDNVKSNVSWRHVMVDYFLPSALDKGTCTASRSGCFTHLTGDCVGLVLTRKRHSRESNPECSALRPVTKLHEAHEPITWNSRVKPRKYFVHRKWSVDSKWTCLRRKYNSV